MKEETIELMLPKNRRGAVIALRYYNQVKDCIIGTIQSAVGQEITLNELIFCVHLQLSNSIKSNLAWYLLQVKQDLEARKMIRTTLDRGRVQYIRINRRVRSTYSSTKYTNDNRNEDNFVAVF